MPPRLKAFYPLEDVKQMIQSGNFLIRENAQRCALIDFGWGKQDILDTILSLKQHHFQKSDKSELSPLITIDSYKARLKGEDIYTHFYVDEHSKTLIINSFKQD